MSMIYRATLEVPSNFFAYLPTACRRAMLDNIVDIVNQTGSATMIGDNTRRIVIPWCVANCEKRFCYDDESHVVMFESKTDMTLFLTALPQSA